VWFLNLSPTSFWRQRHPRASISNVFGRHLEHILNKCGKVETAILCGRVLKNQALEGLCLTLFCHFHVQVFGTSFFMIRLTMCHHFTHLCIHWKPIFNNILQLFRPPFSSTQKIEKSDWPRNLGGSTCGTSKVRGELGGIWDASGRHLGCIWDSRRPWGFRMPLEAIIAIPPS